MELETLVQERMEHLERELRGQRQLTEALRVGAVRNSGPREWLDQVLIRASRGAERRQAARIGTKSEPVL